MDPEQPADDQLDVRHYVHVLSRHRWTIVIAVAATAAVALGLSLVQTKVYTAEARVVLQQDPADTVFNPNTGQRNDPERVVDTEIQIIESRPVQDMVEKKLGDVPKVSASSVGQTDVISVQVTDKDPKRAADVANQYAQQYVTYKQQRAVNSLLEAAKEITSQIDQLQAQVNDLDSHIANTPSASDLKAQRDSLIQQIGTFRQQLDEVQVQSRLKEGGAQVVTSAEPPTSPSSPRPKRNTLLGIFLGLMLGVALAFLREQFDDSIRSKEDIEFVSKLPVLALIPRSEKTQQGGVVALEEPSSQVAEAYRGLRTSVQFANLAGASKLLQMTSPSQSEGKTTTLANLAVAMASAGSSVILVCCDLRRPRIHELFGKSNKVGFTSVLLGDVPMAQALQSVPNLPSLRLLASGPPPPNPSELLSVSRTGDLMRALAASADIVLIDSPPVLPVTDSLVLSRWVDSVVVVASANETSRRALGRSLELLEQVHAPVIGTVLNGVTHGTGGYGNGYGYGYGYGYGSDENGQGGRHRRRQPTNR
ncbi:MAG TPA: polysaccharide biosynthesis tyrosine autokinase [Acidimicrobiales bacterium]|nr:polysaccharide biosynthesis tyrosine autokinase [Acidimicrobiales bacterium]